MTTPTPEHPALTAVRKSGSNKVKVAVSDIDGVLRGKYLHLDKFLGAAEPSPGGGFGFCDVVFGWDMADQTYDNATHTGWQHGFPDALARLDLADPAQRALGRQRAVLPRRVRQRRPHALADLPAPDPEAGAEARREDGLHGDGGDGVRVVQLHRDAAELGRQAGRRPDAADAGHVRLLALRMNHRREFMNALMDEMLAFGVPIEGLHTETGPGVYEVAIAFGEALEQADRAILFKTGAREIGARFGIMPSFMAKWNAAYPGCSGHITRA
jgi:glutamine synthetase